MNQRAIDSIVGLFILISIGALAILAFKVSGLTTFFVTEGYTITADFDNIGQLKVRAPVNVSGVRVGQVTAIDLEPKTFKARVTLRMNSQMSQVPDDTSASILTAGLLGDNYVALAPGYSEKFLKEGSQIEDTHPAIILEEMIGQLLFQLKKPTTSDKK